jgi:hypothetical protein
MFPASSERKLQQQNGIAIAKRMAMKLRNWTLRRCILKGSISTADVPVNSLGQSKCDPGKVSPCLTVLETHKPPS